MRGFNKYYRFILVFVWLFLLFGHSAYAANDAEIKNRWQSTVLTVQNGQLSMSANGPGWTLEQVPGDGDYVRLRATNGKYLHIEHGPLTLGDIQPGWWSAQWVLEEAGDYVRIQNRWKSELYIHIENGRIEAGTIQPGWWSAQWSVDGSATTQTASGGAAVSTNQQEPKKPVQKEKPKADAPAPKEVAYGQPVSVTIKNTSGSAIQIVSEDEQKQVQDLSFVGPGATGTETARQGLSLYFRAGAEYLGYPYAVTAHARQEITVPYVPPMELPQSLSQAGQGETLIEIRNDTYADIVVVGMTADGTDESLASLERGQTYTQKAQEGLFLYFFDGPNVIGDPYVVSGDYKQSLQIPYKQPSLVDQYEGPRRNITLTNRHNRPLNVMLSSDDQSEMVGELRAGQSITQPAVEGLTFFFFEGDSYSQNSAVGHPYTVSAKNNQTVSIPYKMPTMVDTFSGASSTLTIHNNTPYKVTVIGMADETTEVLKVIGPKASYNQKVFKDLNLFFYKGDKSTYGPGESYEEDDVLGFPYLVSDFSTKKITVPYIDIKPYVDQLVKTMVDDMVEQQLRPPACWRDSYGRGVGTIPQKCGAGLEEDAGLCYKKCKSGYDGVGPVCWGQCPKGFRNDGASCWKPAAYKRDEYPWEVGDTPFSLDDARARCKKDHGSRCVTANGNTIVYETCRKGYKQAPMITNLCTPKCPADMTDGGANCWKDSYGRGVGVIKDCSSTQDADAGLCYKKCKSGYNGVGPVCWGICPKTLPVNCGASCAKTDADCAMQVSDQISTPLISAGSIALTVASAGTATGAAVAAKAGATAAKVAAKAAARAAAKAAIQKAVKKSMKTAIKKSMKKALQKSAKVAQSKGGIFAKEAAKDLSIDVVITSVLSPSIWAAMNAATKAQMRKELEDTLYKQLEEQMADPKTIETVTELVMQGVEEQSPGGDFPWESLDPTGIAEIVVAYNMPICSDVK